LFLYKYCYNVTNIVITLQKISKLYVLNDYKGAIQDYNKAIELNPILAKAYNNRGLAKIDLGQKDSGADALIYLKLERWVLLKRMKLLKNIATNYFYMM